MSGVCSAAVSAVDASISDSIKSFFWTKTWVQDETKTKTWWAEDQDQDQDFAAQD